MMCDLASREENPGHLGHPVEVEDGVEGRLVIVWMVFFCYGGWEPVVAFMTICECQI